MSGEAAVYWDPVRSRHRKGPVPGVPAAAREAPLYYNETHDFYALSRATTSTAA